MGVYSLFRSLCSKNRLSVRDQLALDAKTISMDITAREYTSQYTVPEQRQWEADVMHGRRNDNRRMEERITASGDVYILTDTDPQILGQMIEISSGGLAFTFVDLDQASKSLENRVSVNLDLFAHGRGHYVRNLPCRLVSMTISIDADPQSQTKINRVGVSFENLSIAQQVQVNSLIRFHRGS